MESTCDERIALKPIIIKIKARIAKFSFFRFVNDNFKKKKVAAIRMTEKVKNGPRVAEVKQIKKLRKIMKIKYSGLKFRSSLIRKKLHKIIDKVLRNSASKERDFSISKRAIVAIRAAPEILFTLIAIPFTKQNTHILQPALPLSVNCVSFSKH